MADYLEGFEDGRVAGRLEVVPVCIIVLAVMIALAVLT